MKKTICIEPVDPELDQFAQTAWIVNEFKKLGCARKDFVEMVIEKRPELNNYEFTERLNRYWVGRVRDQSLNDLLKAVLDELRPKTEHI